MPEASREVHTIDLRGKSAEEVVSLLQGLGFNISCTEITDLYRGRQFNDGPLEKVLCVWLDNIDEPEMPSFILWSGKKVKPTAFHDDLHLFFLGGKQLWGMNRTYYLMC